MSGRSNEGPMLKVRVCSVVVLGLGLSLQQKSLALANQVIGLARLLILLSD